MNPVQGLLTPCPSCGHDVSGDIGNTKVGNSGHYEKVFKCLNCGQECVLSFIVTNLTEPVKDQK